MQLIEYFSHWEAWAILAALLGIAGLTFWWCVRCHKVKVKATALFFMQWFRSGPRQGRSWELNVIETFTARGTDWDAALRDLE